MHFLILLVVQAAMPGAIAKEERKSSALEMRQASDIRLPVEVDLGSTYEEINALSEKFKELESKFEASETKISGLKSEIAQMEEDSATSETKINELKSKIANMEEASSSASESNNEISGLKSKISGLESKIAHVEKSKFHQRAALMQALETYGAGDLVEAFGDYFDQTEQRQAKSASKVATLEAKVTSLEAKRKAHCQVGHTYFGGNKKDFWEKQEGQLFWDSLYHTGWKKNKTQSFSAFKKRPTFVASISSFVQDQENTKGIYEESFWGIFIDVMAVTTSNATIQVRAHDTKMRGVQVAWVACDQ